MLKFSPALGCALLIAASLSTVADAATVLGRTVEDASPITYQSAPAAEANGSRFRAMLDGGSQTTQPPQQQQQDEPAPLQTGDTVVTRHVDWNQANSFVLSYDATTDILSSVINGGPAVVREDFLAGLIPGLAAQPFDLLTVGVRDPSISGFVYLDGLTLNGLPVGVAVNGYDGDGFRFWSIEGQDFKDSFTLAGTLSLDGARLTSDPDGSAVQFIVGTDPIPEPTTWALMIGGFGLIGAVLRRRRRTKRALA